MGIWWDYTVLRLFCVFLKVRDMQDSVRRDIWRGGIKWPKLHCIITMQSSFFLYACHYQALKNKQTKKDFLYCSSRIDRHLAKVNQITYTIKHTVRELLGSWLSFSHTISLSLAPLECTSSLLESGLHSTTAMMYVPKEVELVSWWPNTAFVTSMKTLDVADASVSEGTVLCVKIAS